MLNEVKIFELRVNYSYSSANARNLIFVCKSANGVNRRCPVVYRGSRLPAACQLGQWAGRAVGGMAAVIQWHDKHEVAPSTRCYRQIVWRHDRMSGKGVSNDATMGDGVPMKDCGYCFWSGGVSYRRCLLWRTLPAFVCIVFFQRPAELWANRIGLPACCWSMLSV